MAGILLLGAGKPYVAPSAGAANVVLVGRGTGDTSALSAAADTEVSGNSYFAFISWAGANITSLVDNFSNVYNIVGPVLTGSGGQKSALYFCANGVGGIGHFATVNFDASSGGAVIHLNKVTGATTSPLGVSPTAVTDTSSPFELASGTLPQANSVIVTCCASDSGSNPATYAPSGFDLISSEVNGTAFWTSAVAKLVVSATTSVNASWTCTGASQANVHVVSFNAA